MSHSRPTAIRGAASLVGTSLSVTLSDIVGFESWATVPDGGTVFYAVHESPLSGKREWGLGTKGGGSSPTLTRAADKIIGGSSGAGVLTDFTGTSQIFLATPLGEVEELPQFDTDPTGTWLVAGLLYFNTVSSSIRLYDGGAWTDLGVYSNATAMPATVGGLAAGTTFSNVTMTSLLDSLLYPYQAPAFTAFTISGQTTPIEVGDSIGANPTFTWTTSHPSNIQANSISLSDGMTLASSLANSGSHGVTHAAYTRTSPGSQVFTISGTNTNSGGFSRTYTVTWEWRLFYGVSALTSLSESDIEALTDSNLAPGFAGTYAFTGGGYLYLCFPSSFGAPTIFKDVSTGFTVPFNLIGTVSVTNGFGATTNYSVYRSFNLLTAAITVQVS